MCLEQMLLSDKTGNVHVESLCADFPNHAILFFKLRHKKLYELITTRLLEKNFIAYWPKH